MFFSPYDDLFIWPTGELLPSPKKDAGQMLISIYRDTKTPIYGRNQILATIAFFSFGAAFVIANWYGLAAFFAVCGFSILLFPLLYHEYIKLMFSLYIKDFEKEIRQLAAERGCKSEAMNEVIEYLANT